MGTKEKKALEEVFNEASAFYDWGKGSDTPHADDLFDIYNNLANIYGRNSASPDYQMSDEDLEAMFVEIRNNSELTSNFSQLVD